MNFHSVKSLPGAAEMTHSPSPPQYVCMCGILRSGSGDSHKEGHCPPHPRQDETQAQQDLCRLSGPEEVRVRLYAQESCTTGCWCHFVASVTVLKSVSQWDLGVYRRDGQRHRYPRRELGAAVRSSKQCQVSEQKKISPSHFKKMFQFQSLSP